jgi:hypothetical protein
MKTNSFYLQAIIDQDDKAFAKQLFNERFNGVDKHLIDTALQTPASGPLSSFHSMGLFRSVNHIDYMRLVRIAREIEVDMSMKNNNETETILTKAQDIVYNRTEEQSRNYGDIQESIERAALIATHMLMRNVSPEDIYTSIVAIKLSREAHAHKEDNLLDAVAYISALNDYLENKKP